MKPSYLFIPTLFLTSPLFAVTPLPAPTLTTAGAVIHDTRDIPGSRIMRITSAATVSGGAINSYSYYPSFNDNSTRLMIGSATGGTPLLYDFNPTTFTLGAKRNLFTSNSPTGPLDWQDAIWSSTDPNVIFAHANTGSKLYSYNVSTNVYTLIKDFSTVLTGPIISTPTTAQNPNPYIWQMSKSADDKTFAFAVRTLGTYAYTGYAAYNTTSSSLILNNPVPSQGLDEVQIDKSARYLVVKTEAQGAGKIRDTIFDLQAHTSTNLIDGANNGLDGFGHSDNGTGITVAADNWNNGLTIRNLATPHTVTTILSNGNDWTQGVHLSMLSHDESKVLASFFTAASGTQTKLYNDQLAFIATDGSGTVTPLGYHYSIYPRTDGGDPYYDSPRADISQDGRFITFTSNWGVTNGRLDVFVMSVPLAGDANHDGIVDGLDFNIWFNNLEVHTNSFEQGDFNGDGLVDGLDFNIWFNHLEQTFESTTPTFTDTQLSELANFLSPAQLATLIPEPTSLSLLLLAAPLLLRRRKTEP